MQVLWGTISVFQQLHTINVSLMTEIDTVNNLIAHFSDAVYTQETQE